MKKIVLQIFIFLFLPVLFLMTSCKEENLKPGIPAYIHVEPFDFETYYPSQGTDRQLIKDVWVFADGATIGVFELPANIPILMEGVGELRLEGGIEINGIATTRINNPFFEPIIIEDFTFIPDSVISISPTTSYRESNEFVWLEDFEDPSISLDTSNLGGNTAIIKVQGDDVFEGNYSGKITLDSLHQVFEAATFDSYVLPVNGRPVLLEMNYKNDYFFSVGIIEQSTSQVIKTEVIVLYAKDDWNKIYINLTDQVRASSATSFKILIRTYITDDNTEANIFLDNFKLMYR